MTQINTMQYKGYIGSIEVDTKENILFGKLLHIKDLVNYEAETPAELVASFHEAVDDYLQDCEDQGVEPDQPFKGQFNVRIDPDLHRALAVEAKKLGKSMNDYVESVLQRHKSTPSFEWGTLNVDLHATKVAHFTLSDSSHEIRRSNIARFRTLVSEQVGKSQVAAPVWVKEHAKH